MPLLCDKGDLVLIHGSVDHLSLANTSVRLPLCPIPLFSFGRGRAVSHCRRAACGTPVARLWHAYGPLVPTCRTYTDACLHAWTFDVDAAGAVAPPIMLHDRPRAVTLSSCTW